MVKSNGKKIIYQIFSSYCVCATHSVEKCYTDIKRLLRAVLCLRNRNASHRIASHQTNVRLPRFAPLIGWDPTDVINLVCRAVGAFSLR
jgi:hypothetical protein